MQRCEDNVAARLNGNALQPLSDVSVTVTDDRTGLKATLYSDDGVTQITQPLITDDNGYYGFYAANGEYTLSFSGLRIATFTRKIVLADPSDNPYATKAELAAGSGATLMTFMQAGAGAALRPVQDKLRDTVDWSDYKLPGDADDTDSLNRALASGAKLIRFRGNKNIGGHVVFTNPVILRGDGRASQVSFTGADAWFKVLGTSAAIAQAIEFENLTFSAAGFENVAHIYMDWARQIKFNRCFIYHCPISANHMNFWNITDCEVYDSNILVQHTRDSGEANEVSGAPRCTASFFSNSLIDLVDCVDLMMTNCHMFQQGVRSRIVNYKNEGGDPAQKPKSTYYISNCIFDSIYGLAWDFWDVGCSSFIGNFISAGRNLATDGASFVRGWHNKVIGNTFVFCGAWGLTLESAQETIVDGNSFLSNPSGGLRTNVGSIGVLIAANIFGVNPAIYGAPQVAQAVGYSDTSSDGVGIRVSGNRFRPGDMATPLYLPVTVANRNSVRGNEGAADVLGVGYAGTTAQRPTGMATGYGPYFDTSLNLPVWYVGGNVWKNAAGVTV